MKKINIYLALLLISSLSILSCSKKENEVTTTINSTLALSRTMPSIEDALQFLDEVKTGNIALISTRGFNSISGVQQVSGGIKNGDTQFGKIMLNNVEITRQESGLYFSGTNDINTLKSMYGTVINYKVFDAQNNTFYEQSHRVPLELDVRLPIPTDGAALSRTSTITWNADTENGKGIYLVMVLLSPTDGRPVTARSKQLPDTGTYTFSEGDFAHIPVGSNCKIYCIRGNADKFVSASNEIFYISSGTIAQGKYKL